MLEHLAEEREEVPHLSRQLVKSIMQGQALDVEDLQEARQKLRLCERLRTFQRIAISHAH